MPIVAEQYGHVVGVDTHARTHTYVIVESATGRVIGQETFSTSPPGLLHAAVWIERRCLAGGVLAAVEGTSTYGARLLEVLSEAGIPVVEVHPPKRGERRNGKSDTIDAEAAARTALRQDVEKLIIPRDGKPRSALRVMLMSRRSMDSHRTGHRNALTALLRSVDLGMDVRRPLTGKQISEIAAWRSRSTDDIDQRVARAEARRLAREILLLGAELRRNKQELRELADALAPGLMNSWGVGPVCAAIFLTAWSHPGRVRSEAAFASLGGVAPIPASSGNTIRYRLSRQGDRQLNRALYVVARARMASDPETRAYVSRRQAEGKTEAEIRRVLKRYIARQIYRELNSIPTLAPTIS
ncbi:IS110 family transposase [Microbacterium sp. CFBP9034]|uniref:IS110 family transposase n=1 Tax=Microbacterium sp. CFBP9034 TaxID=3096540 RepID=UPI002A69D822|nr:IS110 family transposase [Microbacterium sp. CFBP9034]MDY0910730.1 IS110 family transposase [Microbacterium sp. CFBP9034]